VVIVDKFCFAVLSGWLMINMILQRAWEVSQYILLLCTEVNYYFARVFIETLKVKSRLV